MTPGRRIGIAPKDDRLYTAVYTVLGDETVRMISLRLATYRNTDDGRTTVGCGDD